MTLALIVVSLFAAGLIALVAFLSWCCRQSESDRVSLGRRVFEAEALKKRYEFERNRMAKDWVQSWKQGFKDQFLTDRDTGDEEVLPPLGPPAFPGHYCGRCGEPWDDCHGYDGKCQKLTPPPGWEVHRASSLEDMAKRYGLPHRVPHRAHSDVLFIPHPEDLLT